MLAFSSSSCLMGNLVIPVQCNYPHWVVPAIGNPNVSLRLQPGPSGGFEGLGATGREGYFWGLIPQAYWRGRRNACESQCGSRGPGACHGAL